jgi:dihydrofolate reductase
MKKLKLFTAVSMDSFIATTEGKVDWLTDPDTTGIDDTGYGYGVFYETIDTTLMGYNTYCEIIGFGVPFPYPDKKNYVFSRKHKKMEDLPVEFIHENMIDFVYGLKKKKGKDIWLVGGGRISGMLLNADLIDEIILSMVPVVLGNGIPLFFSVNQSRRFKIKKVQQFHRFLVQITFEKN